MNNAQDVPADRWFAMTRLDENRAAAQLAAKANRQVSEVSNVTIWGNHSATQYPDYYNAKIGGVSAPEVISDDTWAHAAMPTARKIPLDSLMFWMMCSVRLKTVRMPYTQ
jgi:malate/lactate dehydrogenase